MAELDDLLMRDPPVDTTTFREALKATPWAEVDLDPLFRRVIGPVFHPHQSPLREVALKTPELLAALRDWVRPRYPQHWALADDAAGTAPFRDALLAKDEPTLQALWDARAVLPLVAGGLLTPAARHASLAGMDRYVALILPSGCVSKGAWEGALVAAAQTHRMDMLEQLLACPGCEPRLGCVETLLAPEEEPYLRRLIQGIPDPLERLVAIAHDVYQQRGGVGKKTRAEKSRQLLDRLIQVAPVDTRAQLLTTYAALAPQAVELHRVQLRQAQLGTRPATSVRPRRRS